MTTKKRDRFASDLSDHADRHAEVERESAEAERAKREIEQMNQAVEVGSAKARGREADKARRTPPQVLTEN
jgi:hypothetical protein